VARFKTRTLLGAAMTLLALGAVTAVASDEEDGRPPQADVEQVAAVEPEARGAMAIFARPLPAGGAMPEEVAREIDERPVFGVNPDLSRLAVANATISMYVAPARGHVCAVLADPMGHTTTCPSTADIVRGKAGPATVAFPEGTGIYGVVPDGVESVSVRAGSDSVDVPVQANAYYTVMPRGAPLRTLAYVGPAGPVEFDIYDPAAVFDE
jgi:hypothetical protein